MAFERRSSYRPKSVGYEVAFAIAFLLLLTINASAFDPKGLTGKKSDGSCVCKAHCNQFAKAGQLAGQKLAQCKTDCEQNYSGCNKGSMR
jgi:hypothetical protein